MNYYLLTWKSLREQDPDVGIYMSFLTKCMKDHEQICILSNAFEYDSKGKMHFHVIVLTKHVRFAKYAKYCFENDMYFHFRLFKDKDLQRVSNYLDKCKYNPYEAEQKEICKYFRNNYGFTA